MPSRSNQRMVSWALTACFVCTLVILAYLQYRWSSEVSAAATTRMRFSLENSTTSFRQELAGELGTLCLALQNETKDEPVDARRMARRLEHWQRTSLFPDLVLNLYLWNPEQGSRLSHLLLRDGRYEEIDWPAELQEVHQRLSDATPSPPGEAHRDGPRSETPSGTAHGPQMGGIDESVPLLIVPASSGSRTSWLLLGLSPEVMEHHLFPQLATRYFGSPSVSDFAVALIGGSGEEARPIYSSEPVAADDFESAADASLNLFGPPVRKGSVAPVPQSMFRPDPLPAAQLSPGTNSFTFGMAEPVRFDPIHRTEGDPNWRIVVKHRKGSVEAAVAALRRRNLAVSFLVLLTMAGSMSLIIYNSYRARRLARLQIDFVAGVSHELRTPVAAILSISDNIASGAITDKGRVAQYGELIRKQARQLNQLVEQVLSFSASRSVSPSTLRPLSVSDAIDEALESTAPLIAGASIDIQCNVDPDTPPAYGDPVKLSHCLQNLLTNAIKYGRDSKMISIDVHAVQNGSSSRKVEIAVSDQGIGINREDLKHIFEPFYRSPQVMESSVHGTGLGLSLTKSYVESMGGEINVSSKPNEGSTFTIRLAAAEALLRETGLPKDDAE